MVMDFFKSVFSDDPDPSESESDSEKTNPNDSQDESSRGSSPTERQSDYSGAGEWDFGGLLKTLSEKSELIIETYKRDLQEFGDGLRKEIEVAQGSLENVGHVIDHFGNVVVKGTTQIISHGMDTMIDEQRNKRGTESSFNSKRYSRFDSQVRAIQGDVSSFSEVPEDLEEYGKWKSEFSLEGKSEEMEGLLRENEAMESVYKRVVPNTVDRETFWFRYYYRVYKLKKAEDVRARLVKRMLREEEELSWDFEDEDDVDQDDAHLGHGEVEPLMKKEVGGDNKRKEGEARESGEEEAKAEKRGVLVESKELDYNKDESVEESEVDQDKEVAQEMGDGSKKIIYDVDNTGNGNGNGNGNAADSDEKVMVERKHENGKSSLVASKQQHSGKENIEWDEIEDLNRIDEKKASPTSTPSKVDLRKRLNAAQEEEEEDLSCDIEDDDEPAKA